MNSWTLRCYQYLIYGILKFSDLINTSLVILQYPLSTYPYIHISLQYISKIDNFLIYAPNIYLIYLVQYQLSVIKYARLFLHPKPAASIIDRFEMSSNWVNDVGRKRILIYRTLGSARRRTIDITIESTI